MVVKKMIVGLTFRDGRFYSLRKLGKLSCSDAAEQM
jgi:hypothetical protein